MPDTTPDDAIAAWLTTPEQAARVSPTPDLAELRRLAEAATPFARPGGTDPATVTLLASDVLGLLDRVREAEAGLDRVAVAMGCGDEVSGYGVYREDVDGMVECARDLRELGSDHDECPRPCHCHDDRLAYPVSCEPCKGSGCGPGTASGAYEPCDHCDGTGADCSKGWVQVAALEATESELAHMREARDNTRAERDALAAKVERVRALPAKHPAGGWYMTSMRDVLAALDEEPQP